MRRPLSDDEISSIFEFMEARELSAICRCGHSRVAHLGMGESLFGHDGPCELADCTCSEFAPAFPYYWRVRTRLPERFGKRCRVLVRGAMNSALVEFEDGFRVTTSRNYIRKSPPN